MQSMLVESDPPLLSLIVSFVNDFEWNAMFHGGLVAFSSSPIFSCRFKTPPPGARGGGGGALDKHAAKKRYINCVEGFFFSVFYVQIGVRDETGGRAGRGRRPAHALLTAGQSASAEHFHPRLGLYSFFWTAEVRAGL